MSNDASLELGGFDIDSSGSEMRARCWKWRKIFLTSPRGARPGTFLHALFEEVEFTEPATSEHNTQVISALMAQEQIDSDWLPVLQRLIDTVLETPLDGKALRLRDKAPSQRLVEMEFFLPIEVLSAAALNRVCQRHDPLSAQAGDLGFQTVQGMLKGFIDLVFEHKGRYYVLDWKSNHLGDATHFYHGEALKGRWSITVMICSTRFMPGAAPFLRSRVADYDYQRHFGGVYYLFLRHGWRKVAAASFRRALRWRFYNKWIVCWMVRSRKSQPAVNLVRWSYYERPFSDAFLPLLADLAKQGSLRQLDYQFARLIASQSDDEALALVALVSAEVGRGHICLPLIDSHGRGLDIAARLGLYGEAAQALNVQLTSIDWAERLKASPIVGESHEALPLIFDGQRLYLQRYWHYEVMVCAKLNQLSSAVSLDAEDENWPICSITCLRVTIAFA